MGLGLGSLLLVQPPSQLPLCLPWLHRLLPAVGRARRRCRDQEHGGSAPPCRCSSIDPLLQIEVLHEKNRQLEQQVADQLKLITVSLAAPLWGPCVTTEVGTS